MYLTNFITEVLIAQLCPLLTYSPWNAGLLERRCIQQVIGNEVICLNCLYRLSGKLILLESKPIKELACHPNDFFKLNMILRLYYDCMLYCTYSHKAYKCRINKILYEAEQQDRSANPRPVFVTDLSLSRPVFVPFLLQLRGCKCLVEASPLLLCVGISGN